MSNARDIVTLRTELLTYLRHDEVRGINWQAVANAAQPALTRGWTPRELADWCASELGAGADNPGAMFVITLRTLSDVDPPRDTTPQPPPISSIRITQAAAIDASRNVDHHAWANRIRTLTRDPQR